MCYKGGIYTSRAIKVKSVFVMIFVPYLYANSCMSSCLGANVNRATANNDHTVVSLACAGGHLAVVELLLAHGADPTHRLKVNTFLISREYLCLFV